jgi:hypothetical protein
MHQLQSVLSYGSSTMDDNEVSSDNEKIPPKHLDSTLPRITFVANNYILSHELLLP